MLSKSLRIAAAVLLTATAVTFASAAENPTPWPGWSLGGRAGYMWPKDSSAGDGDWSGGAQLRAYLAKPFAVEGSADYHQTTFGPAGARTTADIYPVQVTGLVYLTPNAPLSPYILGGVGWYFTHLRGPSGIDETDHRFGGHVGGGLQAFLSRHWSVDASYRYIFASHITASNGNASIDVNGDSHMVTGGINYHF